MAAIEATTKPALEHQDLQITLTFADGVEHTFTVVRDRGMRWHGRGTEAPLVAIDAEWFDNTPVALNEGEA